MVFFLAYGEDDGEELHEDIGTKARCGMIL
jgi:hypothetical protein